MSTEKEYTLVFCRRNNEEDQREILLGMKKRGFGAGRWNGFGGKIEEGESVDEAAKRELTEECSLVANTLQRRGYIVFNMLESKKIMKVHVFETFDFSGDIAESDEMKPKWVLESNIPYDQMWPDDIYWLPLLLEGKSFLGRFDFSDDDTIEDYSIKEQ